jgi:apolipoprotein N-acyltransferase
MVNSLLGPKGSGKSPSPLRRRADNRLVRSILLGAVAVAFSIYWIGRSFDVNWADIEEYVLTSIAFVGLLIAAASVCAALFLALRKLTRRPRD